LFAKLKAGAHNLLEVHNKVSYQCITLINHNIALVQQELMIQQ